MLCTLNDVGNNVQDESVLEIENIDFGSMSKLKTFFCFWSWIIEDSRGFIGTLGGSRVTDSILQKRLNNRKGFQKQMAPVYVDPKMHSRTT